jgi:2-amino-4-hydroxy-6-hydroxymethyldihydropteridine diphosphokinase
MTSTAYIGLGSNIGNPESHIRAALDQLKQHPDIQLDKVSSLYQTSPVGYLNQADFINAVAKINTSLSPQALLEVLLNIELNQGRERPFKDAPRTLDLDLLLFDQIEIDTPSLTLPHPRMFSRGFVLVPLAEIAPQIDIPKQGKLSDLIAQISTADIVKL